MRYKVAVQHSNEGYSVSCPGLPGCWSQGDTEEEALVNIQDAIHGYLETLDDLDGIVRNAGVTEEEFRTLL